MAININCGFHKTSESSELVFLMISVYKVVNASVILDLRKFFGVNVNFFVLMLIQALQLIIKGTAISRVK